MTPFWTLVAVVTGAAFGAVALGGLFFSAYLCARIVVRAEMLRGLAAKRQLADTRDHKTASGSGDPHPRVDASAAPEAHQGDWFDPFERKPAPQAAPVQAAPLPSIEEDEDTELEGRGQLMAVIPAGAVGVELRKVPMSELTAEEKAEVDAQIDREMETAAKQAVADTGLTGPDADRLFQGIMEGIARAKATGKTHGTIAVAMTPGTLEPVGVKLIPPSLDQLAHPGRRVAVRSQEFDFNDGKPVS